MTSVFDTNKEISVFANRKEFRSAWALFEEAYNADRANVHTYSAIINAAVRCGDMEAAERVIEMMKSKSIQRDVIINTTMLKGYCSQCSISKAMELYQQMKKVKRSHPNIRTLNTLLRGFVQTGEVKLAEKLVGEAKELKIALDVSSWEYLVVLLGQSLSTDKILPIVGRLKNDATMQSGILHMQLELAKASALLGDLKTCNKALQFCRQELERLEVSPVVSDSKESSSTTDVSTKEKTVTGGKKAWKSSSQQSAQSVDERRNQSNEVFRRHQLEEWRRDIDLVNGFAQRRGRLTVDSIDFLVPFLLHALLFQCDPTVTSAAAAQIETSHSVSKNLFDAISGKFGMDSLLRKWCGNQSVQSLLQWDKRLTNQKKQKGTEAKTPETPMDERTEQVLRQIKRVQKHMSQYFTSELYLDFASVFTPFASSPASSSTESNSTRKKKLNMEICSGAGEWVVTQAQHTSATTNWVSLELRYDRVHQTFTQMVYQDVTNLCLLAGDAKHIVPRFLAPNTFDHLFVNHPEPPQQVSGHRDDSEAAHLLDEGFFLEMHRILAPTGTLTIVTDNLWYGKLLTRLVHGLRAPSKEKLFLSATPSPAAAASSNQGKGKNSKKGSNSSSNNNASRWENSFACDGTVLWVGNPGPDAGHAVAASSYFDRLWKRESIVDRYFLVLRKNPVNTPQQQPQQQAMSIEEVTAQVMERLEEGERQEKGSKKRKRDAVAADAVVAVEEAVVEVEEAKASAEVVDEEDDDDDDAQDDNSDDAGEDSNDDDDGDEEDDDEGDEDEEDDEDGEENDDDEEEEFEAVEFGDDDADSEEAVELDADILALAAEVAAAREAYEAEEALREERRQRKREKKSRAALRKQTAPAAQTGNNRQPEMAANKKISHRSIKTQSKK